MGGESKPVRWSAPQPSWVLLKGTNPDTLTARAVLTYPEIDYAGDWVQPDGGQWDGVPYVNVEHRDKVGTGSVELKAVEIDGGSITLPVGTTQFTRGDRLSEQTFRLVADDVMTGVSLEFSPLRYKSFGHKSPLENRDAMHFASWRGLGWAHTVRPVNPGARTLLPEVEKAIRVVERGSLDGHALHPIIFKALTPLVESRTASVVGGWRKGMEPEADMGGADPGMDDATPPEASEAHDAAQMLDDMAGMLEARAGKTLHGKTRKLFPKFAEQLRKMAEQLGAHGEGVEGEIAGDVDSDGDGEADESDADPDDPEYKAVPLFLPYPKARPLTRAEGLVVTKGGYVPRFRLSELKPVQPEYKGVAADVLSPAVEAKAEAVILAATKLLKRAAPYVTALQANATK